MCGKIDSLIEASGYDPDKLLAPYDLWPSHKADDLKAWLDDRQEKTRKNLSEPQD